MGVLGFTVIIRPKGGNMNRIRFTVKVKVRVLGSRSSLGF